MLFGNESLNPPSRFIGEIDSSYLDVLDKEEKEDSKGFHVNIDPDATYQVGDHIIHDSFGEGVIVNVDKMILTAAFPHPTGIKKLMKGHKSIRKV